MNKLYLKAEEFSSFMSEQGLSDVSLAEKMNMDRTTIFKARNGNPVGGKFIANFLKVAEGKMFGDFFFCA